AAPPLLGIFDFRQREPGLDRIEDPFVEHARDDRRRAADVQIEMAHPGFELIGHAAHAGAAARGENLHLDAVAFAEILFELPFDLGAGRHRYRDLAFFSRRLDDLVPVGAAGPARLAERARSPAEAQQQAGYRDFDVCAQDSRPAGTNFAKLARPGTPLKTNPAHVKQSPRRRISERFCPPAPAPRRGSRPRVAWRFAN